ncbi:hypothetical protein EAO73_21610 [Streptomyces sp. col6]|nr:hypothetical protein EAO73_21610 [Streptomyces sp. col6]
MTFGTLLSSQGTDASFVLTLSGFPPGASLRSCVSDSIRLFRVRFPAEAGQTNFAFRFFAFAFPFRRVHYFSGFSRLLIIESVGLNSGMPKLAPSGVSRR